MADRAPLTLQTYRLLTAVAMPAAGLLLNQRLKRGKEIEARLPERRGEAAMPRPDGPLVWVHVASVGEMLSVLPLIERIRARDIAVLVTSGTVTAAELAERRFPPGVIHQFVPVDMPQFVARFLDHWRPDLGLFVESDLWPNLIMAAARRDIPLILVNGRLSERSFKRWRQLPRTIGALLGRFDLCLAQTAEDAARYSELGAPRYLVTGNLKLDVPAPPFDPAALRELQDAILARPVLAAASTHPGEEIELVDVQRRLRRSFPGLLTILVPRHPDRGASIAEIARGAGLAVAQRSLGELPDRDHRNLCRRHHGRTRPDLSHRADRVHGRLAGRARRAKSDRGRQARRRRRPWPACVEFRGNLRGARMQRAAPTWCPTPASSTVRIGSWLTDGKAREAVANTGLRVVEALTGALERTVAALDPYLMQFGLERPDDDGGRPRRQRHA